MTILRSEINSNFYQIVAIDENGLPIYVLPEYVSNANVAYANAAGTSDTANLANSLSAPIANVSITGGVDGYILGTDGNGTLSWVPQVGGGNSVSPGGSNTNIQFNNNGTFGGSGALTFDSDTNTLNTFYIQADGSNLTNLPAANVVGTFGNVTVTGNVTAGLFNGDGYGLSNLAISNIAGLGNVSTINLDGNVSNVLSGTGTWVTLGSGNVANANYANFAGTAYSVSGSNVSGEVANAGYATISGTSYSVDVGNVSGIGTIATINQDGSASNVLYGNGTWSPIPTVTDVQQANVANVANLVSGSNVSGEVANAAYATNAGTAYSVDVGNVSGLGNVALINLDGNVSNVLTGSGTWVALGGGDVANANYANFAGTAYSVSGANVSGEVANAGYATISGTSYSVDVANVSGIGSIATINLDSSSSNVLYGNGAWAAIPPVTEVEQANVANVANLVAVGNVSGIGNIATVNLTGSSSNVLYGNGVFAEITITSVEQANVANVANSVAGSNVSGEVANAGYATISGTSYSVDVANVSGIGNIATINLDGNVSNILHGNGYWGPESTSGNANYANFAGTAYSVSGSNVSGAVNLATYATTANAVAGANVSGQVSYAAVANSVAGANVSGAVNLATYATTANAVAGANVSGQVNYAAVANSVAVGNVSGIGNIATINLNGNASTMLVGNGSWQSPVFSIDYLIVGGGGAGGYKYGGGGGGGGVIAGSMSASNQTSYPIIVGLGGVIATDTKQGQNGSPSMAFGIIALGGGGGGVNNTTHPGVNRGSDGSSGGGGGGYGGVYSPYGYGTRGQGNNGFFSDANSPYYGGGGGGAGGASGSANGGIGVTSSISGSSVYYGGGGAGGGAGGGGTGGSGGGGNYNTAGTANTGGGGGGSTDAGSTNGAGGSGVVIIRYAGSQRATGGTITSSGGYTIHTFTSDGTFTTY